MKKPPYTEITSLLSLGSGMNTRISLKSSVNMVLFKTAKDIWFFDKYFHFYTGLSTWQ